MNKYSQYIEKTAFKNRYFNWNTNTNRYSKVQQRKHKSLFGMFSLHSTEKSRKEPKISNWQMYENSVFYAAVSGLKWGLDWIVRMGVFGVDDRRTSREHLPSRASECRLNGEQNTSAALPMVTCNSTPCWEREGWGGGRSRTGSEIRERWSPSAYKGCIMMITHYSSVSEKSCYKDTENLLLKAKGSALRSLSKCTLRLYEELNMSLLNKNLAELAVILSLKGVVRFCLFYIFWWDFYNVLWLTGWKLSPIFFNLWSYNVLRVLMCLCVYTVYCIHTFKGRIISSSVKF